VPRSLNWTPLSRVSDFDLFGMTMASPTLKPKRCTSGRLAGGIAGLAMTQSLLELGDPLAIEPAALGRKLIADSASAGNRLAPE